MTQFRALAFTLAALAFARPLAAQDSGAPAAVPEILVQEGLDPASGAVVGQHVTLHVDVLFQGDMPRPPRVSLAEVPGLQIIRFETQGTTMQKQLDGKPYVGQRFEFALYPRRGGVFAIPPAAVTLLDRQGDPSGKADGEVLQLEVNVPPGVDASQPVVATTQLTMKEQWEPVPTERFKAGDAVVRTITRTATDVPGLAMLDLVVTAPAGVRAYADPPDIEDQSERGVVTGRRVDRITYVFERGGRFLLPALTQPWWDLGSGSLKRAAARAARVDVAMAPTPAPAAASPTSTRKHLALLAGALVVLPLLLGLAYRLSRHRERRRTPESEAFAALQQACKRAEPGDIYQALLRWTGYLPPPIAVSAGATAGRLRAVLFAGDPAAWTEAESAGLLDRAKTIRRKPPRATAAGPLPPLNPGGQRQII